MFYRKWCRIHSCIAKNTSSVDQKGGNHGQKSFDSHSIGMCDDFDGFRGTGGT
jgi:hypothetical protein